MSSPSMHLRAPGWYPAPDGAERWWDGSAWTERVRADGAVAAGPSVVLGAPADLAQRIARARRDATWAPFGLSAASLLGVVAVPLVHVIAVAFITLAVAGVLMGIKAIGLRSRGVAIPLAPPVLGILIGSVSAIALGGLVVLSFASRLL